MLTTLQLEKKLVTDRQFNILVNHLGGVFNEKPTIHEALEWFREVKGVPCSVHLEFESNNSEWFYYGEWGIKGENKINTTETFDTHSLAESALLEEVMEYVDGD